MSMSITLRHAAALLVLFSLPALAGNRTITGEFTGSDPTMASVVSSCAGDGSLMLGYSEAGTIQIGTSGSYMISDAGNVGYGQDNGIRDISALLYEGSFDPANPGDNLVVAVDVGYNEISNATETDLQTGVDYVVVAQHWCDSEVGAGWYGIIIRGPGSITGLGFATPPRTIGNFSSADQTNFPDYGGTHKYAAGNPMQVARTGYYMYADIGGNWDPGSPALLLVYKNSFNPALPGNNFVSYAFFGGPVFLEAGQTYVFVVVDFFDVEGIWQYVLFPPSDPTFNSGLSAAWYNPATSGQGVLAEYGAITKLFFAAIFTFDAPAIVASAQPQSVGSTDQRWLTAYGSPAPGSSTLDLKFENTTGGVFNSPTPAPTTDSNYGTGTVEVVSCENIVITYDLPGGLEGMMNLQRALPDGADNCYQQVPFGPLVP